MIGFYGNEITLGCFRMEVEMDITFSNGGSVLLETMGIPHCSMQIGPDRVGIITDKRQLESILGALPVVLVKSKKITVGYLIDTVDFIDDLPYHYPRFRRSIMGWQDTSALQPKHRLVKNTSNQVSAVDDNNRQIVSMKSSFYMFCDEVMLLIAQDELTPFAGAHLIKEAANLKGLPNKLAGECSMLLVGTNSPDFVTTAINNLFNLIPPEKIQSSADKGPVMSTMARRQCNLPFVLAHVM